MVKSMELRKPTMNDEIRIKKYIEEHYDNGEYEIYASNGLTSMNYEDWLEYLAYCEKGLDKEWGNSETFILINNDKIIGMTNIRYNLSNDLKEKYGNIGYSVIPSERRKGYATYLLKVALVKCKYYGLEEVIVGCYKDNIASNKTILKNGGVLYNETIMDGKEAIYYKIICK